MESNSKKYPEAWIFFTQHTRNIQNTEFELMGRYRISKPDMSGEFIYHDKVEMLFQIFKDEYYKPSINSHSIYGKIQHIVDNF
jgi:hypothetical protein